MSAERRTGWVGLVLVVGLAACGPRVRPAPELHRVVPAEVARGAPTPARIEGAALYAELRDAFWSAEPPRLDARFRVWVGDVELAPEAATQHDATRLDVVLPADLPLGVHAVRVRTPAGQEAVLEGALAVVEQLVASVVVEDAAAGAGAPVGDRELRADGPGLVVHAVRRSGTGRYLGEVQASWSLSAPVGTLVAAEDGLSATLTPMVAGVARISATPLDGSSPASTGELRVVGGVAAVAFATPERAVVAGACAGPLTLELRDAAGAPAVSRMAMALALSSAPSPGVTFFSDPGCTAAVPSVDVPPGQPRVDVYARGTSLGTFTLTARSATAGEASQALTVQAGPAAGLVWEAIAPQRAGVPFAVGMTAVDALGHPTDFAGTATLSLSGAGGLECTAGCTEAGTTAAFAGGRWSGQVVVTAASGGGRALVATGGGLSGTSAPFSIVPARSAPQVTVRVRQGVVRELDTVTLEARASDYQSPAGSLEYSWDFEGNATTPAPWSPWSSTATATHQYRTQGYYTVRVAVRDPEGDVSYGAAVVLVLKPMDSPCIVDHPDPVADDGATSCDTQRGPDNRVSLAEAVRISNAAGGPRAGIGFTAGLRLTGPASFTITRHVWLVGDGDVHLTDVSLTAAGGATLVLSGLRLSSASAPPVTAQASGFVALDNVHLVDSQPVMVAGTLWAYRSSLERCASACVDVEGSAATVSLRASTLADAPVGLEARSCTVGGVDVVGTVLHRLGTGLRLASACAGARVVNVTFDGNGVALELAGGDGHVLRNAAFTANTTAAVCGTATFQQASELLAWGNAADGCLPVSSTLRADPLYLVPEWGDFRLNAGSPAIDKGVDPQLDCNDAAPGNFTGLAPDLGGRETY